MLFLVPSKIEAAIQPYFIPIPTIIDIDRISGWVNYCDQHPTHCGYCHTLPPLQQLPLPTGLTYIDVCQSCLVKLPTSERFLTLSYVWGQKTQSLAHTNANTSALFTPGTLASPHMLASIPATIRDAIELTKRIGVRYLWVDRLCIVIIFHKVPIDLADFRNRSKMTLRILSRRYNIWELSMQIHTSLYVQ
jgi:hypothetical protein